MSNAPGPGFYPDPNDPKVDRYWDGQQWTESRVPHTQGTTVSDKVQSANGTIVAGYIFAVLMPFIGFIIGLTQINRNRHGIWVVVVSVVAFIIWLALIAGGSSTSSAAY